MEKNLYLISKLYLHFQKFEPFSKKFQGIANVVAAAISRETVRRNVAFLHERQALLCVYAKRKLPTLGNGIINFLFLKYRDDQKSGS